MLRVPRDITLKFWQPVVFVGLRDPGIGAIGTVVQMPKTTVNENDFAARPEYEVRFARQITRVEPVTVAEGMNEAANDEFRLGILGPDSGHVGRAAGWGEGVRHLDDLFRERQSHPFIIG